MTVSEKRRYAGTVSHAEIRTMIDTASADYGPGHRDTPTALGVFADPTNLEVTRFEHAGTTVTIAPCVSALAMREMLLTRDPAGWLVIITDRPEEDLGVGLLAHLAGHKLSTPKPWDAVRQQFAATGLEPSLYAGEANRQIAHGLLLAQPDGGWPPAPAGALTREHALGSVARHRLGLARRSLDALGVVAWTADTKLAGRIADLRALAGDELTDATLLWICEGAGAAGLPLRHLLRRGSMGQALPLGLVLGLLTGTHDETWGRDADSSKAAELGLARLAHRWDAPAPDLTSLRALGLSATQVVGDLIADPSRRDTARQALVQADQILTEIGATALAVRSDLLPSGLSARLRLVAHQLGTATAGVPGQGAPEPAQVSRHTADIEAAWALASRHALAESSRSGAGDARLGPMTAAVRLSRWLAAPARKQSTFLAGLAMRQADVNAWVDAAINDAHEGVADPEMAEAVTSVLAAAVSTRDRHDQEFAEALARATRDDDGSAEGYLPYATERVWLLEHLLAGAVLPLAKQTPTLLLVLDGMSTAVATEILQDVLHRPDGWQEALLPEATRRGAAISVLPSLTKQSRCSLLSGKLITGDQGLEQSGYAALVSAHGLGDERSLFHKKPLDSSRAGFAVADDVAHAIADPDRQLVTCVLNTIDDALDRSDPAGTVWTADAVKHLGPLLDRALAAGRTVVMTADHGHVVERRVGKTRAYKDVTSGRSRSDTPEPEADEVLVTGSRVLPTGRAVLPVNERLRYGPLKAGYHGGASPAEVVVPVIVLVPNEDSAATANLRLAPPQAPTWWDWASAGESSTTVANPAPSKPSRPRRQPPQIGEGLFAEELIEPPRPVVNTRKTQPLGEPTIATATYKSQRKISGRIALDDDQVRRALDALTTAASTRMPTAALAAVLGVPLSQVRGATAQLQQLLNVEGYPVLRSEGSAVILDEAMLREQFGLQ